MQWGQATSQAVIAGALALVAVHCATAPSGQVAFLTPDVDAGSGSSQATGGNFFDAEPVFSSADAGSNSNPFQGCATATADVVRSPIYLLLVLDGSGSMNDDNKWVAVVPSIEGFIDDIAQRNDPTFGVGLTIFSDTNDSTLGVGPYPTIDVPIASVDATQAAALHARLDNAQPDWQTPTLAVLTGQYAAMESFQPAAPLPPNGEKVVVFITDGVPYPNSDAQKQPSINLVAREFALSPPAGPITTFAVGVGAVYPYEPEEYDQVFMGTLAIAGGDPNEPCDPDELIVLWNMCQFQVVPTGDPDPGELELQFANDIDDIRSRVTSCQVRLAAVDGGGPVDPSKVNVQFTNSLTGDVDIIPENPTNGWTYNNPDDPTSVILHGASCKELQSDPDGTLQVVLGCTTILK